MIRMSKRALLRERNDAVIKYNDLHRGVSEINQTVDAIIAEVIRAYGTDGEIVINAPKVTKKKQTEARRTEDGKLYIRLRSEDETEGSNQEGECDSPEHD